MQMKDYFVRVTTFLINYQLHNLTQHNAFMSLEAANTATNHFKIKQTKKQVSTNLTD